MIAYALDKTERELTESGSSLTLEDIEYFEANNVSKIIGRHLAQTNFSGVSVRITPLWTVLLLWGHDLDMHSPITICCWFIHWCTILCIYRVHCFLMRMEQEQVLLASTSLVSFNSDNYCCHSGQ